jgi:4a-hydroxytetrahydrobiopterin dehydratase
MNSKKDTVECCKQELLKSDELEKELQKIPNWKQVDNKIELVIKKKNFKECINLVNKITDIAEEQQHHPDIHITSYNNLKIVLYTFFVNGLSINDIIIAQKINDLIK